ncbi:TPA_asm: vP1 [Dog feces bidnaparvovirus]|nr:TPA_asm: vP1 [Dog feces bidnaparvovirus]
MKFTADIPEPNMENCVENPIPRDIPSQSVTLNFTQRSWEEIGPGELYYLPICQNPYYMMDECMINQFRSFDGLWSTMEISTPHVKMSNLIMLQDDLRVQNNTPTDATAFTQVVYLIHYVPKNQQMYFALESIADLVQYDGPVLTYRLDPHSIDSRLAKVNGFESFEKLLLLTANPGETGGFDENIITDTNHNILSNYLSPRLPGLVKTVSGNLQMPVYTSETKPTERDPANFINNKAQMLFAKNQDEITFHKYGDVIEFDIVTNLEGKRLLADNSNDFTIRTVNIPVLTPEGETISFKPEWCWPGKNRPYVSRSSNLDYQADPYLHAKSMKPLQHHFFCMPPIKKPNGALLGQRVSFLLEQSFSVTFHFSTAVFSDFDMEDPEQKYIMDQKDGIILRNNVYGKAGINIEQNDSPFCGRNSQFKCATPTCPDADDWPNLIYYMLTLTPSQAAFHYNYEISNNPNLFDEDKIAGTIELPNLTTDTFLSNPTFQGIWMDMSSAPGGLIRISITEAQRQTIRIADQGVDVDALVCGRIADDSNAWWFYEPYDKAGLDPPPASIYLYVTVWSTNNPGFRSLMAQKGITCVPVTETEKKSKRKRTHWGGFKKQKTEQRALTFDTNAHVFFS